MTVKRRFTQPLVDSWTAPGRFGVGGGLYLYAQQNVFGGVRKSWVFRYTDRVTKKLRDHGIGSTEVISLREAKERALRLRAKVAGGGNPVDDKQAELEGARLAKAKLVTFGQCVEGLLDLRAPEWRNAKHRQQWENTLSDYCGDWYDLPVAQVDKDMVLAALKPRWTTHTETASRVRQRIENVFDWATAAGAFDKPNPARWKANLEMSLAKPTKVAVVVPRAALPHADVQNFMRELKAKDTLASKALTVQILTATRPNETVSAEWSEFDLDKRLWTIPAKRMKANREHRVPLSLHATTLLKQMQKETQSHLVFPGERTGRPLRTDSVLKLVKELRPGLTSHGFRSTFRDWGAEKTNEPREVMEAALAHVVKDKTEASYFRSDLFKRRKSLMERWGTYCMSAVKMEKAASNAVLP